MSETEPTYRVIVSGVVRPEKSRAEVIEQLALLFHSKPETMEKLLQGRAVPLTRPYQRAQAEKICRAIRAAGAECRMEEAGAPQAAPPEVEPVAAQGRERDDSDASADAPFSRDHQDHPGEDDAEDEDEAEDAAETETAPGSGGREAALMRFVAVNTDYYARQFAKFGAIERPSFALSWHWPALFAFFFWAMYRKLWLWAGVNLAGGVLLAFILKPGLVYLAWAFFWPLTANYLYFRHARNRVFGDGGGGGGDEARADSDDDTDSDTDTHQADSAPDPRGGVSRGAVWVGLLVMFLLPAAFNNLISERVLERYAERAGQVLPEPGSRQRGDGSAIDDLATLDPQAAKTVTALGVLAVTLKLAASGKGPDDSQLTLSVFEKVLEQKRINDAWGKRIALRRDAAGQVALVSAGPDGRFDSGDDILQYIHFDAL